MNTPVPLRKKSIILSLPLRRGFFVRVLLNGHLLARTPLGFLTQFVHFAKHENEKHEQRDDAGGDPENAESDFQADCFHPAVLSGKGHFVKSHYITRE